MDEQSLAERIRLFLRQLFGSRVVAQLEESLWRQRDTFAERLRERDETIAEQRSRIAILEAKLDRYETVLLPLTSPVGNLFKPKREPPTFTQVSEPPTTWEQIYNNHMAKEFSEETKDEKPVQVS